MKRSRADGAGGATRPGRGRLFRVLAALVAAGAVAAGGYVALPASAAASQWIAVASGMTHTCAIKIDTTVWCWGSNDYGQLGVGDNNDRLVPTKVGEVGGQPGWLAISAGHDFTCGIRNTGSAPTDRGYLYCWGANSFGQLGLGDTTGRNLPRRNGALAGNWVAVDLGFAHACGVRDNGTGQCWGRNHYGALGVGHTSDRTTPTTVRGGHSWKAITAGFNHSCGLDSGGERFCWGANDLFELGLAGDVTHYTEPAAAGDGTWLKLDAGNQTTCGRSTGRRLYCFGANTFGHAGVGNTNPQDEAVQVASGTWADISSGGNHACAITTAQKLYCWGFNEAGQLGLGDQNNRVNETALPAGFQTPGWSSVSAGARHTCGIRTDATLWCWGDNDRGQLGLGTTTRATSPVGLA